MKPEEYMKRVAEERAQRPEPVQRRLVAKMDFKKGVGYVHDPDTGEQFGNWVGDWRMPHDEAGSWFLYLQFSQDEIETVDLS